MTNQSCEPSGIVPAVLKCQLFRPCSHVKHLERCLTDLLEYLTVVLACETDMPAYKLARRLAALLVLAAATLVLFT